MAKYVEFIDFGHSASGKTRIWRVTSKEGGESLGFIEWYAPWRKYTFAPSPRTVYEQVCLRDIADFCEAATREHKAVRGATR